MQVDIENLDLQIAVKLVDALSAGLSLDLT